MLVQHALTAPDAFAADMVLLDAALANAARAAPERCAALQLCHDNVCACMAHVTRQLSRLMGVLALSNDCQACVALARLLHTVAVQAPDAWRTVGTPLVSAVQDWARDVPGNARPLARVLFVLLPSVSVPAAWQTIGALLPVLQSLAFGAGHTELAVEDAALRVLCAGMFVDVCVPRRCSPQEHVCAVMASGLGELCERLVTRSATSAVAVLTVARVVAAVLARAPHAAPTADSALVGLPFAKLCSSLAARVQSAHTAAALAEVISVVALLPPSDARRAAVHDALAACPGIGERATFEPWVCYRYIMRWIRVCLCFICVCLCQFKRDTFALRATL